MSLIVNQSYVLCIQPYIEDGHDILTVDMRKVVSLMSCDISHSNMCWHFVIKLGGVGLISEFELTKKQAFHVFGGIPKRKCIHPRQALRPMMLTTALSTAPISINMIEN